MVLDHDGYLPSFAVLSEGKTADIPAARQMSFAPGTMLAFDRGYADYGWWLSLTRQKVHFVTRLKDSAEYGVAEQCQAPEGGNIIRDEVIVLCAQQAIGPQARSAALQCGWKKSGRPWCEPLSIGTALTTTSLRCSHQPASAFGRFVTPMAIGFNPRYRALDRQGFRHPRKSHACPPYSR